MPIDHAVCPHCGCHCEDDEFCAACGRLFHEEEVDAASRKVSLSGVMKRSLRSLSRSIKPIDDEFEVKEDPETCPSWYFLPNNIHHEEKTSNPASNELADEDSY